MVALVPGFVASVLFVLTTLNTGIAVVSRFRGLRESPAFIAFAVAVGFIISALGGLILYLLTPLGPLSGWLVIAALNVAAAASHRGSPASLQLLRKHTGPLAVWMAFSFAVLCLALVPPREPVWLSDGPYPFKEWTLPVKVQSLTGDMPADNALPAYVGEMMARKISFEHVRPVMPGQELANRPFLLPLVYLPYRMALGGNADHVVDVPTIAYVGTTWPNVGALISDDTYFVFLGIGIAANASVILAFAALLRLLGVRYSSLLAVIVLALTPYEILHTLFTWPKNLAAFFITTAFCAAIERRSPAFILPLGALAYWSHPYAIAFAGGLGLYLGVQWMIDCRRTGAVDWRTFRQISIGAAVALSGIAAWVLWTKFGLNMSGDLVEQNQGQNATLSDALGVRLQNLATVIDFHSLSPSTFGVSAFNRGILTSLVSALGVASLLLLPVAIALSAKVSRLLIVLAVLVPSVLVSVVFGVVNPPLNHGWQASVPMLAALVLVLANRLAGMRGVFAIAGLSLISSGYLVASQIHQWQTQDDRQAVMLRKYAALRGAVAPGVGVVVDISGVVRRALFTAADSQVEFGEIDVRPGDVLRMYISVHPETYGLPGDVTIFRVEAVPERGLPITVFQRGLDVRTKRLDRGWMMVSAPLGAPLSGKIKLRFTCGAGAAGNTTGDWCIWGEPAVTRAPATISAPVR